MNNLTCLVPVSAIVSVSLLVCSCSTSDPASSGTAITNVKYFHLDHEQEIETPDMMIRFERKHYMHGAITADEKRDREGHYYVIWWESKDKTTPATLLFEYRQLLTGPEIQTIEVPIDRIRKKNKTHINITGEPYHTNGRVTSWRASVVRNGSVVAEDKSYLWE